MLWKILLVKISTNTPKRLLMHRKLLRQKCSENSVQCITNHHNVEKCFLESKTLIRTSLSDGWVSISIGEGREEKIDDQDMIIKLQQQLIQQIEGDIKSVKDAVHLKKIASNVTHVHTFQVLLSIF